jgi:hypothetical protein
VVVTPRLPAPAAPRLSVVVPGMPATAMPVLRPAVAPRELPRIITRRAG